MIVETSEYKLKYLAIFLTTTLQVISLNSLNNTSIETSTGSMHTGNINMVCKALISDLARINNGVNNIATTMKEATANKILESFMIVKFKC